MTVIDEADGIRGRSDLFCHASSITLLRHVQQLGGDEFNKTKINKNEFCLMICQLMTASKWSFLLYFRHLPVKNK